MISRRSFFKGLASIVAAVAIAPEICFRTKLDFKSWDTEALDLNLQELISTCYDIMRARQTAEHYDAYDRYVEGRWIMPHDTNPS